MCVKLTMIIIVLEKMPKILSNRVEQSLPFAQPRTYLFAEGNDPPIRCWGWCRDDRLRFAHPARELRQQAAKRSAEQKTGSSSSAESRSISI